jgi:hypothetical protein
MDDGEVLFHLNRLRLRQRLSLERSDSEPCANALAMARERGEWMSTHTTTPGQGLRIKPPAGNLETFP